MLTVKIEDRFYAHSPNYMKEWSPQDIQPVSAITKDPAVPTSELKELSVI